MVLTKRPLRSVRGGGNRIAGSSTFTLSRRPHKPYHWGGGEINRPLPMIAEVAGIFPPGDKGDSPIFVERKSGQSPAAPRYDPLLGKLFAAEECLHCFRGQARNQAAILLKFQESGWQEAIVDPLGKPPLAEQSRKCFAAAIKNAVSRLNLCQTPRLILFRCRALGGVVTWEWSDSQIPGHRDRTETELRLNCDQSATELRPRAA
jgi:hypothetical protein